MAASGPGDAVRDVGPRQAELVGEPHVDEPHVNLFRGRGHDGSGEALLAAAGELDVDPDGEWSTGSAPSTGPMPSGWSSVGSGWVGGAQV